MQYKCGSSRNLETLYIEKSPADEEKSVDMSKKLVC